MGSLLRKVRSSTKALSSISISPDRKILATAASQLKIFSSDFKKMQKFSGHPAAVCCLIFTEDGKYILSSAVGKRYIAVWKIDGGRKQPVSCVLSMDHPAVFLDSKGTDNVGADNDGLFVLAISELGLCYFWHGRNVEELCSTKPTKISLSLEGPFPKYQKSSLPTIFAAKLQGIVKLGSAQVSIAYGSVVKPSFEKLLVQHGLNVNLSRSQEGVLLPKDQSSNSKKRQVSRTEVEMFAIQPLLHLSGRLKLISAQINKAGESTIQAFSDDHQVDESGYEDEDIVELVYGEEEGSESGSDTDN